MNDQSTKPRKVVAVPKGADDLEIVRVDSTARRTLAYCIFGLIAFLQVSVVAAVLSGAANIETAKELSSLTITPLIGVFGIVVGYFFGEAKGR